MVTDRVRLIHSQAVPVPVTEAAAMPPIWKESLWPMDWLALRLSPVYFGHGVPHGDGSAVVLVPGFMAADAFLFEMHGWLRRIGYRPYMSGIGLHAECPGRSTDRLIETVERAQAETGRRVRIVGHSLGGIIGRRVCLERPELISQLVYLGSPLQALHAHPVVTAAVALVRLALTTLAADPPDCLSERCNCGFLRGLLQPLSKSIHHAAIFTRSDGIVDWRDALETDARLNYEVKGTHTGLVCNAGAYRALAELLAGEGELARAA